jgi:bacillopeptidase F (M6 metalloprotease family)
MNFQGARQVGVVPEDAFSGEYAFWSNKGDESDMRLTQTFDFTGVSGPLTLSYQTWYDLETDYDYLYLLASEDDGQTWDFLITPSGTAEDPSGNSYVGLQWAERRGQHSQDRRNGRSPQYAGKKVQRASNTSPMPP